LWNQLGERKTTRKTDHAQFAANAQSLTAGEGYKHRIREEEDSQQREAEKERKCQQKKAEREVRAAEKAKKAAEVEA